MKHIQLIAILLGFLLLNSCKKDKNDPPFYPTEIQMAINGLSATFDSIGMTISLAVEQYEQSGIDTSDMRATLLDLHNSIVYSQEFVYVNPLGIMEIIEPAEYYQYQGSDISTQPHVITAVQTLEPVLSNAFTVVEGYQAAVDVFPMAQGSQYLGTISLVFKPEDVAAAVVAPLVAGQSEFEIWVMEKTGLVLYDQDTAEIGLNVLTDPLYEDFPELIAACELIANEEKGETQYSFFQSGTSTVVTKKTYWGTFYYHGNEWKVVWVKPIP